MITREYRQVIMWGQPPSAVRRAELDCFAAPTAFDRLHRSLDNKPSAPSFNGRTPASGAGYRGSNPWGAAKSFLLVLTPHILCIQAARDSSVSGSFDNRPPIGEQRHLIRLAPEFQHEFVVAHPAMRLQPAVHLGKIHGPGTLMNLH